MKHGLLAIVAFASWIGANLAFAETEPRKIYVFGNSLIHHATDSDETTVPHWLAYFAEQDGRAFELDGEWGFLRNWAAELPPSPQWGFKTVTSAWSRQYRSFDQVGYDTILLNPANFVQYQSADTAYDGDNATGISPLSATVDLLDGVATDKRFYIYEGWADLAPYLRSFPPNARRLRKYHNFNQGEFHDWHIDYAEQVIAARPDAKVTLIPVARVLARAALETGLGDIPVTELYSDDAPHGTATQYFLAAAVTYAGLFGEAPKLGPLPQNVHPLVKTHFADLLRIIKEEVSFEIAASSVAPEPIATQKVAEVQIQKPSKTGVPALGVGLNGIADWSTQAPFVNHMKSARQWVGHLPDQFGGWGQPELVAGGHLDADGWPIRIPDELVKIETLMLTDLPEDAKLQAGVYRLTYEGTGKVDLAGTARPIKYGDREIWFRFQPGEGFIGIVLNETDPEGIGDYVRNIAVVREDQIPLYEAGVVFNPEWIAQIEDLRLVRFMDWMFTNGSEISTWDQRPIASDYSFTRRGVPLELMLELANQIGADPWFNMPHTADDAYVQAFATQVRDGLRPGLKAYTEYSNELWNFLFPQTHWAVAQARERWGDAGEEDWMQFAGMRGAEMARIWTDVFADQAAGRLVRVAATHTDWPGLEFGLLNAPLAVKDGAETPHQLFDAYAVTGYFGHGLGTDEGAPEILQWIAESQAADRGYDLAVEKVAQKLRDGSLTHLLNEAWPYQAKVAKDHDLDLLMYEGGTHVVGVAQWTGDETLTEFFKHLNYTPEMAQLYQELLAGWNALGGTVFNAFVDVAMPTQWGSWGALRHLADSNPRHDALLEYNAAGPVWADARDASDFAHGLRLTGTDKADVLVGTALDDILLAGAGNDELTSDGGTDYLHGGAGDDHAVLPGFLEEYRFFREGSRLRATSEYGNVRLFAVETIAFSKAPDVILSVSDFF